MSLGPFGLVDDLKWFKEFVASVIDKLAKDKDLESLDHTSHLAPGLYLDITFIVIIILPSKKRLLFWNLYST